MPGLNGVGLQGVPEYLAERQSPSDATDQTTESAEPDIEHVRKTLRFAAESRFGRVLDGIWANVCVLCPFMELASAVTRDAKCVWAEIPNLPG